MVHTSPHAEVDGLNIRLAVCTDCTLWTVSDCCLTPSKQFISHIMARTSYIPIGWRLFSWHLIIQVPDHYPDSKPTSPSTCLLILHVCVAEKQQMHILYPLVWPQRSSNPQSSVSEANTLTITYGTHRVDIDTRLTNI